MASGKFVLSVMLMILTDLTMNKNLKQFVEKRVKSEIYIPLECEEEDIEELLDQETEELKNVELFKLEEERVAEEEEEKPRNKRRSPKGCSSLSDYQKVNHY